MVFMGEVNYLMHKISTLYEVGAGVTVQFVHQAHRNNASPSQMSDHCSVLFTSTCVAYMYLLLGSWFTQYLVHLAASQMSMYISSHMQATYSPTLSRMCHWNICGDTYVYVPVKIPSVIFIYTEKILLHRIIHDCGVANCVLEWPAHAGTASTCTVGCYALATNSYNSTQAYSYMYSCTLLSILETGYTHMLNCFSCP